MTLASSGAPHGDDAKTGGTPSGAGAKSAARHRIRTARRARRTLAHTPIPADPLRPLLEGARRTSTSPGTIACYLAMPTEPDTSAIIGAVHAAGRRVIVPAVAGRGLTWHELTPRTDVELASTGPAIRQACSPALPPDVLDTCDLMLIPALSVDRRGHRLGQGGGYYDRALADFRGMPGDRRPVLIAVTFDSEVVQEFPPDLVEPHDVPVDAVLTQTALIWLPQPD